MRWEHIWGLCRESPSEFWNHSPNSIYGSVKSVRTRVEVGRWALHRYLWCLNVKSPQQIIDMLVCHPVILLGVLAEPLAGVTWPQVWGKLMGFICYWQLWAHLQYWNNSGNAFAGSWLLLFSLQRDTTQRPCNFQINESRNTCDLLMAWNVGDKDAQNLTVAFWLIWKRPPWTLSELSFPSLVSLVWLWTRTASYEVHRFWNGIQLTFEGLSWELESTFVSPNSTVVMMLIDEHIEDLVTIAFFYRLAISTSVFLQPERLESPGGVPLTVSLVSELQCACVFCRYPENPPILPSVGSQPNNN